MYVQHNFIHPTKKKRKMRLPIFLASMVATTFMIPESASPENPVSSCPINLDSPDYCNGTDYNATLANTYVCGDLRLGPVKLPAEVPLNSLLGGYDRFGGLCPGEFIGQWWNVSGKNWYYPPEAGFLLDSKKKPISGDVVVQKDALLDRFGFEGGTFVSLAGTPYTQRAIPPRNLNTFNPDIPSNYYRYRVKKSFSALAGPTAPWFGQAGMGLQYSLYSPVKDLIVDGFVERI
ncbi:hypothetical protein D9757_006483 [Collybiopsis confluens]|uniref:TNT domain-containing protein n=1 Tax=Collybiopsis confluens TaxID=2823264 RepID=A0A8H5HJM6_9AGAR|nr:hypothetical protein D9757_006483 [Collybiopsis confluens]